MKIEKGVPIPPKEYAPRTIAGRTARDLEVGDRAFCETFTDKETLRQAMYHIGRRAVCRKGESEGKEGWWIWRKT